MKQAGPLLCIKNLSISSGSQALIKNFNLEFKAGDFKTISAPTGSGKTTLFNYIAGILPQDTFKVSGDMIKAPGLRISYAFQEPRLIPSISVLKNIMLPLQNLMDLQQAQSLAKDWLSRFNLSHKALDLPENLSGGEKQRANLARAFAYTCKSQVFEENLVSSRSERLPEALEGPYTNKLLLLDEPFSSQDEQNAQNIQSLIKEILLVPDTAVLLITHDRSLLDDTSIIL